MSQPGNQTSAMNVLPNFSRSKKSYTSCSEKLFPDSLKTKAKLNISLVQ